MDLYEVMRCAPTTRRFEGDPVPREILRRVLHSARFAPSGGNRQGWRVVVVRDPLTRRRLRDLYQTGWYEYLAMGAAGLVPWAPITDREAEQRAAARAQEMRPPPGAPGGLAEQLDGVPALLVVLADLRRLAAVDRDLDRYTMVGGASIYPFVWSVLLAAHEHGLGGVLTTMLCREE